MRKRKVEDLDATPVKGSEAEGYGRTQYTKAEQYLIAELSRAGIPYTTQRPFSRNGEYTKVGCAKQYVADIIVKTSKCLINLEVEGEGTSSDEQERDRYFEKKGIRVVHIPNEVALKYSYVIAALIKALT
ncbi:MAG: hypothetical protein QXJ17_08275 [Nitrososphaeria archaeon]